MAFQKFVPAVDPTASPVAAKAGAVKRHIKKQHKVHNAGMQPTSTMAAPSDSGPAIPTTTQSKGY